MMNRLTLLKDEGIITDQEWTGIEAVKSNPTILTIIYNSKATDYDQLVEKQKKEKAKKDAYYNSHEKYEGDKDDVVNMKRMIEKLGYSNCQSLLTKNPETGEKLPMLKLPADACAYILQLMFADKAKAEAKYEAENAPKPTTSKKSSGGKRAKFQGEIKYVNTPETAEGKDHKFYFKGDETATFTKPTFTAKDGSYQNHKHKAVKSDRYLGGAESKPDDGNCNGVCIWDRAVGSTAIANTGISPAKFKVRCGGKATADGYCSKCAGKGSNFFTTQYDLGKNAKGAKFNGTTYCQFITDNLEYA